MTKTTEIKIIEYKNNGTEIEKAFFMLMKKWGYKTFIIGKAKKRVYFTKNILIELKNYLKVGGKTFTKEELDGIIDIEILDKDAIYFI